MTPRLFVLHTMLLPALLVGLVAVHLGTVVSRRRQRDPRPARAFASTSLLLLVAAVLALLGGVAQINPVWQLGPYHPAHGTSPAQPDWYLAFLDGLVRLARRGASSRSAGPSRSCSGPRWGCPRSPSAS